MENKLKKRLEEQIVIFDGAIGTELYRRNVFVNTSFESICLSNPDIVQEIHEEYVAAGAEVLTSNTYGANSFKLSKFGLDDKVLEINSKAVELARKAGGDKVLVAGSVGPVGENAYRRDIEQSGNIDILAEQVAALESAGADFIMFETISSLKDTEIAYQAINRKSTLPYVMSFSLDRHGDTSKGEHISRVLQVLNSESRKPTALGLNCGTGAEPVLSALEIMMPLIDYPVIVQPNAGLPKNVDNRMIYMTSPEYLSTYAKRYVDLGARGVGGCCGTGPDHIRDMARSIKPLSRTGFSSKISVKSAEMPLKEPASTFEKSRLGAKLAKGEWIATVEIVPPRGYKLQDTIEKAVLCRKAGVDAINIPDGPRASSRISPIVTALQIQREANIEAILHFCCRDKNLIGMQADLLGCACLGINNILFVTGDPPKLGDYPYASAVFDVDSIGMVAIQDRLNRGVDLGGKAIDRPTEALIGVGADPNAIDMERELRRTREKVEAGAEFIITQPVFDVGPLLEFMDKISNLKIPLIAGIWPLASYRNAEFMKHEVPGVTVPDSIMKRMAEADSKEEQKQTGIRIARESIEKIRDRVAGIQVSAPFGNVSTAISVIRN